MPAGIRYGAVRREMELPDHLRAFHPRNAALKKDSFGQLWTILDKMLCYNSSVKDDGSGLSFVYELFIRSMDFRWMPNSPSCIECLLRPRDSL